MQVRTTTSLGQGQWRKKGGWSPYLEGLSPSKNASSCV